MFQGFSKVAPLKRFKEPSYHYLLKAYVPTADIDMPGFIGVISVLQNNTAKAARHPRCRWFLRNEFARRRIWASTFSLDAHIVNQIRA